MTARWSYIGPPDPRPVAQGKCAPAGLTLALLAGIASGYTVHDLRDTYRVTVIDGQTTVIQEQP